MFVISTHKTTHALQRGQRVKISKEFVFYYKAC